MRSLLPGAAIAIGSAFAITEWLGHGDAALLVLTLLCASSVALAVAAASVPDRDRVGDLLV